MCEQISKLKARHLYYTLPGDSFYKTSSTQKVTSLPFERKRLISNIRGLHFFFFFGGANSGGGSTKRNIQARGVYKGSEPPA